MKAATYHTYGPPNVLSVQEIAEPTLQAEHAEYVLVEVHAASVNQFDVLFRQGYWPVRLSEGLLKPKNPVLGVDVAGIVREIGPGTTRFKVGDRVFGGAFGSHAQLARVRERGLVHLPDHLAFSQVAAMPTAAMTALQGLRDVAKVQPGQEVLINGASGGVGHFAVQLAKHFGAHVTAVCSTANLAWVKELGADHVLDYTRQDFTRLSKRYDLILDAVSKSSFWRSRPALKPGGLYITENPFKPLYNFVQMKFPTSANGRQGKAHPAIHKAADHQFLLDLLERGQLRPVIEHTFPLEDIAAAHTHVQRGHTKGKIVIQVR